MLKTCQNIQSQISSLPQKLMTIFQTGHAPSAFHMDRSPESSLGLRTDTLRYRSTLHFPVPINSVRHPKVHRVNVWKHEEVFFHFRKKHMEQNQTERRDTVYIVCFCFVALELYCTELIIYIFNYIKTEYKLNWQDSAPSTYWDAYSPQLYFTWPVVNVLYPICIR